ncbi:Gfo/Idh/MocA family protein [Umezawaea sp. NPDC059074]|uniref:Gfo/Idh/MocA family protein n=1 Tax=Umezawaea sp. NPDC059074 TaxID=3346716 RepID=UPI0036C2BA83
MTGPVRLGVLGCADIAVRRALPAVVAGSALRAVVVGSRSSASAQAVGLRFGADAVTGYQAVLDRDDVEAVYVPLPSGLHAEWVERALLAGKHVLAEKPLTTDLVSTAKLVALARSSGLVLWENFAFLHHGQHAEVAATIARGEIGDLRGISATFTIPPRPPGDIRLDPALGGGALLDVGAYPVRVAQFLLGPDLRVAGSVLREGNGVDLGGSALLHRPDGVTARLAFGLDDTYACEYEVFGSTGRLLVRRAFTAPADHRPVLRIENADGTQDRVLPADDQWANVLAAFAAAVRGDPAADHGEALLRQAELLDLVRAGAVRTTGRKS